MIILIKKIGPEIVLSVCGTSWVMHFACSRRTSICIFHTQSIFCQNNIWLSQLFFLTQAVQIHVLVPLYILCYFYPPIKLIHLWRLRKIANIITIGSGCQQLDEVKCNIILKWEKNDLLNFFFLLVLFQTKLWWKIVDGRPGKSQKFPSTGIFRIEISPKKRVN